MDVDIAAVLLSEEPDELVRERVDAILGSVTVTLEKGTFEPVEGTDDG